MAPRKQRPGYASRGQYQCRRNTYDPATRKILSVCLKPVPPGELTYVAVNTLSGHYLALCKGCRKELDGVMEEWISASEGSARLLAELTKLPNGELVSETALRELLDEVGERDADKKGPLSATERKRAIELEMARRSS
jgi:hypothetical protein